MLIKLKISCKLTVKSGLHIGTSEPFSSIGSVDSYVIRDPMTNLPIVPGSSLKGKMRYLLSCVYNTKGNSEIKVPEGDYDDIKILNLFGKSQNKIRGRLIFTDSVMDKDVMNSNGLEEPIEVKAENAIPRVTKNSTKPRQIERVVRGSQFPIDVIYTIYAPENVSNTNKCICNDFRMIQNGFFLIENDYLGGNGTRGHGKVEFSDFQCTPICGISEKNTWIHEDKHKNIPDDLMKELNKILSKKEMLELQ